jgi:hypothetical protein
MVLFSGMEKTSHWAALYFVALMTFGKQLINPHQNESFYYLSTAFFFTFVACREMLDRNLLPMGFSSESFTKKQSRTFFSCPASNIF